MIKLTDLQGSRSIIDDLAHPFHFDIDRASRDYSWIKLTPEHRFLVIAGESTGGAYLSYGSGDFDQMPVLYVTSEGSAGKVASNLSEFLAIIVALPYWEDLLKFSGGGNLAEMRKAAELGFEIYEEEEIITSARIRLTNVLDIQEISDPIGLLHRNVESTDCTAVAEDGYQYGSLFNRFTSDDIRRWE
ncbi:hypothetical protein [Massilia sp. CCM 8734]|uniref:hypothetical protein n=1 Tax=Massilia sp. CCM 8734 TaxID=2609283 RepID=UPI00141F4661|nr:hypothetical protein [Massilia sp. CCM 8734]NIA00902.1 hypothetical protein [Massilia sp. CCM 8734]